MPRGDKSAYTAKQKRQAAHIETSYQEQGYSADEAAARAWATVNKMSGGGEKSGLGKETPASEKKIRRKAVAKSAATTRATGRTAKTRRKVSTGKLPAAVERKAKARAKAAN